MYDIIIVGAGPAGSTLARLLGKQCRILVLDKRQCSSSLASSFEVSKFEKCCGGLIAPDAQKMLGKFGLGIPRDVLVGPQLFMVRSIDITSNAERFYQRNYINVNREKFDQWLVSLLSDSVEIVREAVVKGYYEQKDGSILVTYVVQGKTYTATTKLLVGADGGCSTIRRQLGLVNDIPKTYVAIQEYYEMTSPMPYFTAIFDEDVTDFYSWIIPKDNVLAFGAAVEVGKDAHSKFELLRTKLQQRGFNFGKCIKRNGSYLLRPQTSKQICVGKNNVILIGEAAGWISPSSAEGMSYAFRSAEALALAIQSNPEKVLFAYKQQAKTLYFNLQWKQLKSSLMYHAGVRNFVMHTGILAMRGVTLNEELRGVMHNETSGTKY